MTKDEQILSLESKLKQAGLEIKGLREALERAVFAGERANDLLMREHISCCPSYIINCTVCRDGAVITHLLKQSKETFTNPSTLSQEVEAQIREDEKESVCRFIKANFSYYKVGSHTKEMIAEEIIESIRTGGVK